MRILLAGQTLVAGGRESPEGLSLDFDDEVQVLQFIRAAHAQAVNRGNGVTRVRFQVTRTHGSFEEAAQFLMTHKAALPKTGDIEIMAENQEGQVTATVRLLHGTLHSVRCTQWIGCATIWSYQLTGGEPLLLNPQP